MEKVNQEMPNSSNSDPINLNPTNPDDKIDYNQDQKHGIVEIFVTLRLPIKAYECVYGIHRIANYRSFDDYVSDCIIQEKYQMI